MSRRLELMQHYNNKCLCDQEQKSINAIAEKAKELEIDSITKNVSSLFLLNDKLVFYSDIHEATAAAKEIPYDIFYMILYNTLGHQIPPINQFFIDKISTEDLRKIKIEELEKIPGWKLVVTGKDSKQKKTM